MEAMSRSGGERRVIALLYFIFVLFSCLYLLISTLITSVPWVKLGTNSIAEEDAELGDIVCDPKLEIRGEGSIL